METIKLPNFPRITIITPSFNQATFLERTLRSVLDQGYPNLEYIVIDGGSTDGSVEIIRQYADRLAYWVSEPDRGQTDAINKGLRQATGEWVAWQNSDDIYYPGVFMDIARSANKHINADLLIGNMTLIDVSDRKLRDICYVTPTYNALLAEGMVLTNQAAFWRRNVHAEIGWLDESLHYCFDYEWFLRLLHRRQAIHINQMWGGYRLHDATKTSNWAERFNEEKTRVIKGRELSAWKIRLYKLRRLTLMLGRGQLNYIFRGIWRHARGRGGELY